MRIALISLDQAWEDKIRNREKVNDILEMLQNQKTDLVIFPEMTLTGFTMNITRHSEVYEESVTNLFFQECSEKYLMNIIYGLITNNNDKADNNLILSTKEGNLYRYKKIHPFSFSGEDKYYTGGNSLGATSFQGHKIGLTICYDLRFPEIFQALSRECHLIINIANWPEKRVDHWLTLLKARAIENQSYIIGVNRTGKDGNNLNYVKSSRIFTASGTELKPELSLSDQIDIYEIDFNEAIQIRESFPLKQDRKTELYKKLL